MIGSRAMVTPARFAMRSLSASASNAGSKTNTMNETIFKAAAAATCGAAMFTGAALMSSDHVPAQDYGFDHRGFFTSFDMKSVRRGWQVYKEVCATCHSLERLSWRQFENVIYSPAEVKALAADVDYVDGPNDEGEMFERPGKPSDPLPKPYANDEAARAANGGALPPDLSLIAKARHGGEDYLFALLTGYEEPPAGKVLLPGLYYNPYFAGGAIAMEKQLNDGQLEYEDGTPATASQLAKDVSTFLAWAAEPEHDDRKATGMKVVFMFMLLAVFSRYYKAMRWSPLKTAKLSYVKK